MLLRQQSLLLLLFTRDKINNFTNELNDKRDAFDFHIVEIVYRVIKCIVSPSHSRNFVTDKVTLFDFYKMFADCKVLKGTSGRKKS